MSAAQSVTKALGRPKAGAGRVTSLAIPKGTSDLAKALYALPTAARKEAEFLDSVMRRIDLNGARGWRARADVEAARMIERSRTPAYSADTLRRRYTKWRKAERTLTGGGVLAMVDGRRSGETRARAIPDELVVEWRSRYSGNDKRARAEAWRTIIRDLRAGERLPGVGTWRSLWHKLYPCADEPEACPWSEAKPPPGFSRSSFEACKAPKGVELMAKKGGHAAWSHVAEVRTDLSDLRPFEWLVVDDHRLDFKVYAEGPGGKVQLVELWGLFVMDVATRAIVSFGLKPRLARDDGSRMAFEFRDMQHLVANVHATYGVPLDYETTWIVENAAAAVSAETEALLGRVSGGRVKVHRSGIQVGDFRVSGFPERWGNFRGKRWLESYFGLLDIACGSVKGQIGSDYRVKPGDADAREQVGKKALALIEALPPKYRQILSEGLPFEFAAQAHGLVNAAVEATNRRTLHKLEGFDEVRFFRWSAGDPQLKPIDRELARLHGCEADVSEFLAAPDRLRELWLSHGTTRPESPLERLVRLHDARRFEAIATETFVDLMFDSVTRDPARGCALTYKGGNVVDVPVKRGRKRQVWRFAGGSHSLSVGDTFIARLDVDRPEAGVWLLDDAGRFAGHLHYRATPKAGDVEALKVELGAKMKSIAELRRAVASATMSPAQIEARIAELERMGELSVGLLQAAGVTVPQSLGAPSPESASLAGAVLGSDGVTTLPKPANETRKKRRGGYRGAPLPKPPTDEGGFSFE